MVWLVTGWIPSNCIAAWNPLLLGVQKHMPYLNSSQTKKIALQLILEGAQAAPYTRASMRLAVNSHKAQNNYPSTHNDEVSSLVARLFLYAKL